MPDVHCRPVGDWVLFRPLSIFASRWIDANIEVEPEQRVGHGVMVELFLADALVDGMREAGLVVEL